MDVDSLKRFLNFVKLFAIVNFYLHIIPSAHSVGSKRSGKEVSGRRGSSLWCWYTKSSSWTSGYNRLKGARIHTILGLLTFRKLVLKLEKNSNSVSLVVLYLRMDFFGGKLCQVRIKLLVK